MDNEKKELSINEMEQVGGGSENTSAEPEKNAWLRGSIASKQPSGTLPKARTAGSPNSSPGTIKDGSYGKHGETMADMDEPIPQELSAAGGSLPPAFSLALASKTVNRNLK